MRRRRLGLLTCVFVCALGVGGCQATQDSDSTTQLRVLAIHDFHGALKSTGLSKGRRVGGAPALKAYMDSLTAACACPTVRVDAGDQMQGTLESNLSHGASVVAAFNLLGLDAAAVGNHELDWGVDTLLARQREARYAWLVANVHQVADGERPQWAKPFTLIERNGLKVGVIGYLTVITPRTLAAKVTAPYEFRSGYAGIQDAVEAVWAQHPDFVVLVAHAGADCDADGCTGEMAKLAAQIPPGRVHAIASGHDHSVTEGSVAGIPLVRAGASGRGIAVIDLFRDAKGIHSFRIERVAVDAGRLREDRAMQQLLEPYLQAAAAYADEPVTVLAETLRSSATGDRRLGHFIAETARLTAQADVGMQNSGGVRADLPEGEIDYGDVYRVLPFGNAIVRLQLSGAQLLRLIAQVGPLYYFANLELDAEARFADGTPIRPDALYSLATNDFLADGGGGLEFLMELPRERLETSLLDAVLARLRTLPKPLRLPASEP